MPVSFDEAEDSPFGSYQNGQYTINRHGWTSWSDVAAFAAELMPPTLAFGGNNQQQMGAALPGNSYFRVTNFSHKPFGQLTGSDSNGLAQYNKAEWSIQYQTPPFTDNQSKENDPVGFLTHRWGGGGEFLTLPSLTVSWDSAYPPGSIQTRVLNANAGIFIPTIEHSISWDRVFNPPFAVIRNSIGKVNNANFQMRTGICTPETLLFTGPELEQQIMSNGARAWKVTYKFSERRVPAEDAGATLDQNAVGFSGTQGVFGGWNHFWRDQSGKTGFWRLYKTALTAVKTTSYCTYDVCNFNLLFPQTT